MKTKIMYLVLLTLLSACSSLNPFSKSDREIFYEQNAELAKVEPELARQQLSDYNAQMAAAEEERSRRIGMAFAQAIEQNGERMQQQNQYRAPVNCKTTQGFGGTVYTTCQ